MKQATAKLTTVMAGATEEAMVAFVTDSASRETIVKAAVTRSWPEKSVRDGDIAAAIQYATELAAPSIVIVEFTDIERATLDVSALSQFSVVIFQFFFTKVNSSSALFPFNNQNSPPSRKYGTPHSNKSAIGASAREVTISTGKVSISLTLA